jgi:hypothetical protein
MFAPPPRSPDVEYRIAYGLALFDCTALHASLSPSSCADNYINRKCFACTGCSIGATHSGKAIQTSPDVAHRSGECIRCRRQDVRRQIAGALCVPCYNREREVLKGRNAKGAYPTVLSKTLHRCTATLSGKDLMTAFYRQPLAHARNSLMDAWRASRQVRITLPRLSVVADGYSLDAIVADEAELSRLIARRLPSARIITSTIFPSFADCRQS